MEETMRLRYAGECRECGAGLAAGATAVYERSTKTVRCVSHEVVESDVEPTAPIDVGIPGASARREHERRRDAREQRIRTKHPKIGGLILAMSDDPQSTTAWDIGATGEERLGARLNELAGERLRPLHDRRVPGTRANIDHVVVSPSGVHVIDAKKYRGRPTLRVTGGLLRPRVETLLVGTRNCTKLVDGMERQLDVVRGVVGDRAPVHGVLCFVDADWPLLGGAFVTRGITVAWPKKVYATLAADGPLTTDDIAALHAQIASTLAAS